MALENIEDEANRVEEVVEQVREKAEITWDHILAGVHATWLATQGLVRAGGGSVQTVMRAVIGSTISAISTITPVLSALMAEGLAGMNPYQVAQALAGLASIGLATGALISAQMEEQELSDALRGANMALHGVQSLLLTFSGSV